MKTAKEMFKELGYKCILIKKDEENVIGFDLDTKSVYKTGVYDDISENITLEELKAINKQVEELGWNE